MKSYTTILGDTWDLIAKKVYGDETKAELLMDANRDKLDILIFDDGVAIVCPDTEPDDPGAASYPEWRR